MAWLGSLSCGNPSPPPVVEALRPRPPALARLSPRDIAGDWRWSLATEADGVRRIEVEHWRLQSPAPAGPGRPLDRQSVMGTCERVVTFLSMDGMPFECNQALAYELRATYRVQGTITGGELELAELSYETADSPCEPGHRRLATYRGERIGPDLVLRWPEGEQTLKRDASGKKPGVDAQPGVEPRPAMALAGAWRWQSRNQRDREVRVEIEEWDLVEEPGGAITGTVMRTVTIFDAQGEVYDCNGNTYYQYRDRYTLRGHRTGDRLGVNEVAVEAEPSACLTHQERHLDAAVGELVGDHVVLTWRGNRRQILHRP